MYEYMHRYVRAFTDVSRSSTPKRSTERTYVVGQFSVRNRTLSTWTLRGTGLGGFLSISDGDP